MRDNLKMLYLWTSIEDQAAKVAGTLETEMAAWRAGHDKICAALRFVVDGNAYGDIEDVTNTPEAWKLSEGSS